MNHRNDKEYYEHNFVNGKNTRLYYKRGWWYKGNKLYYAQDSPRSLLFNHLRKIVIFLETREWYSAKGGSSIPNYAN